MGLNILINNLIFYIFGFGIIFVVVDVGGGCVFELVVINLFVEEVFDLVDFSLDIISSCMVMDVIFIFDLFNGDDYSFDLFIIDVNGIIVFFYNGIVNLFMFIFNVSEIMIFSIDEI